VSLSPQLVSPRIFGAFNISGLFLALVLSPVTPITELNRGLSEQEKEQVKEAFNAIHSCGVIHGDVELRHIALITDGSEMPITERLDEGQSSIAGKAPLSARKTERRICIFDFDHARFKRTCQIVDSRIAKEDLVVSNMWSKETKKEMKAVMELLKIQE